MNKAEISDLFKRIKRSYSIFHIPDDIKALREMVEDWSDIMRDVPADVAKENLRRYILEPDNKYPPHPGALAKPLNIKTDSDRYHEYMRASGMNTLQDWEQMKKNAIGPTEDQRRRVYESLRRTN